MSSEEFVCKVCNLDYSTWHQFEEHFWSLIHHKQLEIKFGSGKLHICSLCNVHSDSLSTYAKHLISQTHRSHSDERKKQRQLQGPSAPSSHSNNKQQHPNVPQECQEKASLTASHGGPAPQTGKNVQNQRLHLAQQFSHFGFWGDIYTNESSVHSSFQNSSAQQWNDSSRSGNFNYAGNRKWTPRSDFEYPQNKNSRPYVLSHNSVGGSSGIMPGQSTQSSNRVKSASTKQSAVNKDKGGSKDQSAASKSSLYQHSDVKDKTPTSSKPNTAARKPATVTKVEKRSSIWDNPVKDTVIKQTTIEKPATMSDRDRNRMASADEPGSRSASSIVVPLVTYRPLTSSSAETSQNRNVTVSSSTSAITQHVNSSNPTSIPQRTVSMPSTFSITKSPPEVTRLNLTGTTSNPGHRELHVTGAPDDDGVNTKQASESPDVLDEEASVTRVQLPPSLRRELTKLLVKSQAPRPRPNLAAARSRLHAGAHHQPHVVESPDRMIQQLLMKLLDSPKSHVRQVQQIEELQRLVQASKKGSERARFGIQQIPEVSLSALESLLQSGHLKPLLSNDDTGEVTTPDQELPTVSGTKYKQTESTEAERTLNLINTSIFHQEHPTLSSATEPEQAVDSKEAVRALVNSTTLDQDHPMTSVPGTENVDSKEALKSLITVSEALVVLPTHPPTPKHKANGSLGVVNISSNVEPRATIQDEPLPNSEDGTNDTNQSLPIINVMVKSEPGTYHVEIQSTVQREMPYPVALAANPCNTCMSSGVQPPISSRVQPPIDGSESMPCGVSTSTANLSHCSYGQDSSTPIPSPMEVDAVTCDSQAEVATNLPSSEDQQLMMPSAPVSTHESLPTQSAKTTPSKETSVQQNPTKRKEMPANLEEFLLELSLQEELLHTKLGTVSNGMKTTKELILKKQLKFKKLKEQKNKISMEILGIRTRRLQLLTEATLNSCSASVMTSATNPTLQLGQGSSGLFNACASGSLGPVLPQVLEMISSRQGEQVSSVSVSDSVAITLPSASGSVCDPALSGLEKHCLDSSSPTSCSSSRSLSGTDWQKKSASSLQAVVGNDILVHESVKKESVKLEMVNVSTGRKRKLQQDTLDTTLITKKANTTKMPMNKSPNPKATGTKPRAPSTTVASHTSTQDDPSTSGNVSLLNSNVESSSDAELGSTTFTVGQETLVLNNCVEDVKPDVGTLGGSEAEQAKPLNPPEDPAADAQSWTSAGTNRPVGKDNGIAGMQTRGSPVMPVSENYEVFEISSDSEPEAQTTDYSQTRSHPSSKPPGIPLATGKKSSVQGGPPCGMFPNHDGSVLGMCTANQMLYTVAADCTARVFDVNNFSCQKILTAQRGAVTCVAMWKKCLCTGSADHTVSVYHTQTLMLQWFFVCEDQVTCLEVRCKHLYAALANGNVHVFNLKIRQKVKTLTCKAGCKIESMTSVMAEPCKAAKQQIKWLVVGYEDWTIGVHDILNGNLIRSLLGHNGSVLCMTVYKKQLFSGSADKTVMIHDMKTGQHVKTIWGHGNSVTGIDAFDGNLVTSCLDGKIRHFSKKGAFVRVISAFPQMIRCMARLQKTLYTGCTDGTVQAVSMQTPAKPSTTPKIKIKSMRQLKVMKPCQWSGCVCIVAYRKMLGHLRDFHMKQDNHCQWGKCRVKFSDDMYHGKLMTKHAEAHLKDLYKEVEAFKKRRKERKKERKEEELISKRQQKRKPAGKQPAGKQPVGKKPAGKKPAGKKPAGKKPAGKKPAGKKPAGKKPAGKKPARKKPAGKKPAGKKPAGKKPAGKKPAGKKPVGKKPAGKKPVGKKLEKAEYKVNITDCKTETLV